MSRRLNDGDWQNLCLGWFNITDAEHPDFHLLFAAPQGQEEETVIIEGASKDKGKGKASRPPSTDIHSPRDPEPAVKDESEPSEEERELTEESLSRWPDTPMPGEWGRDLHKNITTQQLEEVVRLDPGDFGDPAPEYRQLPQNTNAAARAILREEPLGTTPAIAAAVLGTTIGVNTAFTPGFWLTTRPSSSGI